MERGALLRALLGSVSSEVLRRTAAPVLLLPPRICEAWQRRLARAEVALSARADRVLQVRRDRHVSRPEVDDPRLSAV